MAGAPPLEPRGPCLAAPARERFAAFVCEAIAAVLPLCRIRPCPPSSPRGSDSAGSRRSRHASNRPTVTFEKVFPYGSGSSVPGSATALRYSTSGQRGWSGIMPSSRKRNVTGLRARRSAPSCSGEGRRQRVIRFACLPAESWFASCPVAGRPTAPTGVKFLHKLDPYVARRAISPLNLSLCQAALSSRPRAHIRPAQSSAQCS
jgi:hypothetical protein